MSQYPFKPYSCTNCYRFLLQLKRFQKKVKRTNLIVHRALQEPKQIELLSSMANQTNSNNEENFMFSSTSNDNISCADSTESHFNTTESIENIKTELDLQDADRNTWCTINHSYKDSEDLEIDLKENIKMEIEEMDSQNMEINEESVDSVNLSFNSVPNFPAMEISNEYDSKATKEGLLCKQVAANFSEDNSENNKRMSDSESAISDIEEVTISETSLLVPEKSKHRYRNAFFRFDQWRNENKLEDINEKTMLIYFKEKLATQKASSLWCNYSMLRTMISIQRNIDISKFKNLMAFLKKKAEWYKPKKSKVFKKDEFERFLKEASDDTYLMMKVALIIGIAGACRREELTYLLRENVKDEGNFIQVQIPDSKRKISRNFVVMAGNIENMNLIEIVRKYINLRPKKTDHHRFFVSYRKGKCTKQPVGINTLGAMPKNIALFLGLPNPEEYTGHCFRRSSATLLADACVGADVLTLK